MQVTIVFSPRARQLEQLEVDLAEGATLADALEASGFAARLASTPELAVGVWGRKQEGSYRLQPQDRVEVYRPLRCDPKEARRQRYRQRISGNPTR